MRWGRAGGCGSEEGAAGSMRKGNYEKEKKPVVMGAIFTKKLPSAGPDFKARSTRTLEPC
jgi:hypothetical protein